MGKQQTKKSKRQAELRSNMGARDAGARFIVRGRTFRMGGHATAQDIAEHLRSAGYVRGAEVKWNGGTYTLDRDLMGDATLVRL